MAYETILLLHIGAFVFNISLVILADIVGLLWVLGKIHNLPKKLMVATHRFIWLGLLVSIVTGVIMFWGIRDYLLTLPAFYTKMLFLFVLLINSLFISKHLKLAFESESFSVLDMKEKSSFFISGAISTVSWIVVFVSAKMFGL